jgi:hypothetical protein
LPVPVAIARMISTMLNAIQASVSHTVVISVLTAAGDLVRIKSSTRYFTDSGKISH